MKLGDTVVVVSCPLAGGDFKGKRGIIQEFGQVFIGVLLKGEKFPSMFYEDELRPLDALTQLAEQATE